MKGETRPAPGDGFPAQAVLFGMLSGKGEVRTANYVTACRLLCAALLMFLPVFSPGFYAAYLAGGISDAVDGMIARHFGETSAFGARLDTAADMAFTLSVVVKLLMCVRFPAWLIVWGAVIAGIKAVNIACGFVRTGHFAVAHTGMNKITGLLLFFIPLCLGHVPHFAQNALTAAACVTATLAAVQEGRRIRTGREDG